MKISINTFLARTGLTIGAVVGAVALSAAAQTSSWTAPTATPPDGNVPAPINVGKNTPVFNISGIQEKTDSLILDGGLNIWGNLVVSTGTPAENSANSSVKGKVLTAVDDLGTVGWGANTALSASTTIVLGPLAYTDQAGDGVSAVSYKTAQFTLGSSGQAMILAYFNACGGGDAGDAGNIYLFVDNTKVDGFYVRDSSGGAGCWGGTLSSFQNLSSGVHTVKIQTAGGHEIFTSYPGYGDISLPVKFYVYVLGATASGNSVSSGGVTKIIAGSNVTISPTGGMGDVTINAGTSAVQTGSVGGGCYIYNHSGLITSKWGNATAVGNTSCTCPSGYSSQQILNDGTYQTAFLCLKN